MKSIEEIEFEELQYIMTFMAVTYDKYEFEGHIEFLTATVGDDGTIHLRRIRDIDYRKSWNELMPVILEIKQNDRTWKPDFKTIDEAYSKVCSWLQTMVHPNEVKFLDYREYLKSEGKL